MNPVHTKNVLASITTGLLLLAALGQRMLCGQELIESPRALPVVAEVDVVVVGGGSGGVAAAVEAARLGAKVYLAAPRPYLGEDLCAPYRLWLEPGEIPSTDLAREMFPAAAAGAKVASGASFTYTANRKPFTAHADTTPPSKLSDGKWGDARSESVQYNDDVELVCDLGKSRAIRKLTLMAYQRLQDYEIEKIELFSSDDAKTWKAFDEIKNARRGQKDMGENAFEVAKAVQAASRYIKLLVRKTEESDRLLIGEIIFEGDADPVASAPVVGATPVPSTPMQVKRALDQALIKANVQFLYGCYVTEVLRDSRQRPAGVVVTNRAGRQAILAKVIIDATHRGTVARLAKAAFSPFVAGPQTFQFNVVGGSPSANEVLSVNSRANPIVVTDTKGVAHPVIEYTVRIPMKDDSFGAYAAAEQLIRDLTWKKEQVDASETPFQISPVTIRGEAKTDGAWPGAEKLPLEVFNPAGMKEIFVLGSCADVSREAAAQLVRPLNIMNCGTRVGAAAAEFAKNSPKPAAVKLPASAAAVSEVQTGEVREVPPQYNARQGTAQTIPSEALALPVIGEYDVVVVGGGTGGAPAAISAGRQGVKTLLVEYLHSLGGVGTVGLISTYYHGNRVGFTKEIDVSVAEFQGPEVKTRSGEWVPDAKAEWYRKEMRKHGVDIWCGTLGAGAYVETGKVRGIIVATPHGRGIVLAKVVIDSTGNADIAAAAGAECTYTSETEVAVQGTGLPPRGLNARYLNTDYTYVDETDVFDIWRAFVMGRQKYKSAYDLGQLIDTRERRRIIGDVEISPLDALQGRTWPDTIEVSSSNFDSHGYTIHPLFLIRGADKKAVKVPVPYRCLLPRGIDGILVTGLGVSAHRDALPLIRMQADIQNQGFAAGIAASLAAKEGKSTRAIDIKAVQKQLVEKGNVPETVLTDKDSFPLPKERLDVAVKQVLDGYKGLEVLLTDPEASKPLLREALKAPALDPQQRRIYAHILGMLGDPVAADALIEAIKASPWDKGWQFKGMGQFGASLSPLDSLIIALGLTGDKRGVAVIVEKASQLKADSDFSHFRAVTLALERLADPAAAKPLADLLQSPGVGGHALTQIATAIINVPTSGTDDATRRRELIEINLARALYRCGDHQGVGEKVLRQYAQDLRGHYSRHTQAVLNGKK